MSRTLRDTALRISPPWLTYIVGRTLMGAMVVQLDAMGDRLVEGMRASGPEYAARVMPDALPFIGRDRGVRWGFAESAAGYGKRLVGWLDDWATAGNAFTLMKQAQGYLSPFSPRLRVVNDGNAWRTVNADGSKEYLKADPKNWDWSGEPAKVSRCWLIIYCDTEVSPFGIGPNVGNVALWGGAIGTPGYTIGSTATPAQVQDLRAIVDTFKGAASKYEAIVLAFDDIFAPGSAPGDPMPDGGWQYQTTNTGNPATAARHPEARYIRGF